MIYLVSLLSNIIQEPFPFLNAAEKTSVHSQLTFVNAGQSMEPSNSIFNSTQTSPDKTTLVIGVSNIIRVYKNGLSCDIPTTEIKSDILKMHVGNTYLALNMQTSDGTDYIFSIFLLSNCNFVRSHTRLSQTIQPSGYTYNSSKCEGDFKLADSGVNYYVALGCPNAARYNYTISPAQINYVNIGLIHYVFYDSAELKSTLISKDNVMIGSNIALSSEHIISGSGNNDLYYARISSITGNTYSLLIQQITTDTAPVQFMQILGNSLFVEVTFNTLADKNINLMEFKVELSGMLSNVISIYNTSISNIQKLQFDGTKIYVFTVEADRVQILDTSSNVPYTLPGAALPTSVKLYTLVDDMQLLVLANSPAQSLNQKDLRYPSLITRRSSQNRQVTFYQSAAAGPTYKFMALSVLDTDLLTMTFETDSNTLSAAALTFTTYTNPGIYPANFSVVVTFTTGSPCDRFQLKFDAGAPVYSFTSGTGTCSTTINVPGQARNYQVSLVNYFTQTIAPITIEVIPGTLSTLKNAIVQPLIMRSGMNFSIKVLLSDAFQNTIVPQSSDCASVEGTLMNAGKDTSARYEDISKAGTVEYTFPFTFLNNFCVFNSTTEPEIGIYYIKLKINNVAVVPDEQVGQQLMFNVYEWPYKFTFGTSAIIQLVIYGIIFFCGVVVLPFTLYWVVEGREAGKNIFMKDTKRKKQQNKIEDQNNKNKAQVQNAASDNNTQVLPKKNRGLGEITIRGQPLMLASSVIDFTALKLNQNQLQIIKSLQVSNTTSNYLIYKNGWQTTIVLFSVSYNNTQKSLFINLLQQESDYVQQLNLFNKLKINKKMPLELIQQFNRNEINEENELFSHLTTDFFEAVFVIAPEISNRIELTDEIITELKKLEKMKPARFVNNARVFETAEGNVIGPPEYQGPKYLLYGE
ncbi:Conserved_hypothetical protein [Hexamita inflata]|uniref:Transmembrane protein n=1 Tax=Hexamita inflata TaxID=28002 RepID=A0AA86PX68_9EUKA|nr:Conserved hypothetical protein [Hexamita inflata]